jgi:predicted RNase H-like nuclease (RuvC/YqgF family)
MFDHDLEIQRLEIKAQGLVEEIRRLEKTVEWQKKAIVDLRESNQYMLRRMNEAAWERKLPRTADRFDGETPIFLMSE